MHITSMALTVLSHIMGICIFSEKVLTFLKIRNSILLLILFKGVVDIFSLKIQIMRFLVKR